MSEHETVKQEAKEKMLEALFEYATSCYVDDLIKENSHLKKSNDPELALPPEFENKMKKLIASYNKKEKIQSFRRKTLKFLPKAAIFLLVIIGTLTIVVGSVEALRIKVLNMFLNTQYEYINVKLQDNNDQSDTQTQQEIPIKEQIPPNWNGYILGYVPQGFTIIGTEEDSTSRTINYANQSGKAIRFTQYLSNDTDLRIDTEDAVVEHLNIQNNKAILAEKNGRVSIVWQNDYLFYLVAEADKYESIKMAESITK